MEIMCSLPKQFAFLMISNKVSILPFLGRNKKTILSENENKVHKHKISNWYDDDTLKQSTIFNLLPCIPTQTLFWFIGVSFVDFAFLVLICANLLLLAIDLCLDCRVFVIELDYYDKCFICIVRILCIVRICKNFMYCDPEGYLPHKRTRRVPA